MKKALVTVVALGLAAAVAYGQATEVKSVNVVGFVKRAVPTGLSFWGVGFDKVNDTTKTFALDELIGSQLVGGEDPFAADNVLAWDKTTQGYKLYWYYDDGSFAAWIDEAGEIATDQFGVGDGFFIKNRHAATEVAMMGEVVAAATNSVQIVQGLNMISYPYSSSMALSNTMLQASGAVGGEDPFSGDNILGWNETTQNYSLFWLYDDGTFSGWIDELGEFSTEVMGLGKGYWFLRRSTSGFDWNETKPYTL